ncbi:MAG: FAD-dependent thymidylate synthase [Candidatus Bilamarchaeaceae archaeon]
MAEEFTEEEKKVLHLFVSNTDKNIFVLKNLPEVVKGALFSRYSRSSKSLRRLLLDEFIGNKELSVEKLMNKPEEDIVITKKAEEFYDRVLVGFGDDSVAELAGTHLALENISILATKAIEDCRIGLSPLEKSTRYVYFDKKVDGKWLYYEEPRLMEEFPDDYREACNRAFETYTRLIQKISKYVSERLEQGQLSDRAYEAVVRAKTCDILRGLLPASTLTNMGIFGNGRAFEYLLIKLYASNLSELKIIAAQTENELKKTIPSFVKRASERHGIEMQEYLRGLTENMISVAPKEISTECDSVRLVDYDKDAEVKIIAAMLYPHSALTLVELEERVRKMSEAERRALLSAHFSRRTNRRHKPARGFERVYYTFEVCTNFGAYRDLHRHRMLTQQRQLLTTKLGYDIPKEIVEAGHESEFKDVMEVAANGYERIAKKLPEEAQYIVPLAYRIRWQITMNLREAFYLCELRSTAHGHRDYRHIAQEIYRKIKSVHPFLTEGMMFVDMKEYEFERLESEKRMDKKIEEIKKKYGKGNN